MIRKTIKNNIELMKLTGTKEEKSIKLKRQTEPKFKIKVCINRLIQIAGNWVSKESNTETWLNDDWGGSIA